MPEALGCQERPGCCRREAQEGATEPDTHPADGADVHGLRVVAAVEQPLGLQQHGQTGLRGEEAKLWLQIARPGDFPVYAAGLPPAPQSRTRRYL